MKFFFDENLSPKLAEGMKGFGEDVVHLKELFPPGEIDARWIPYVGENELILITRDQRIPYNPAEKETLKTNKVGAFSLSGKNLTRCKMIQQLVRNWPRMKELSANTNRPFAFRVPPNGVKITKIF